MTKMPPTNTSMPYARKKDKKVEVSLTNWMLGGSLVCASTNSSTRSASRRVRVLESDDEEFLIKSPQPQKAEKKAEKAKYHKKSDEKADSKQEKSRDEKAKGDKCEKCDKCGKKKATGEDKSKIKSDSKSDDKKGEGGDKKSGGESTKEGGGSSDGKGWTSYQDTKIKEMKGENKSWKEIALEVGASKKDVQNRYKELMKSDAGDPAKKDDECGKREENSGWVTVVDDADDVGNGNMPDFGALFEDVENHGEEKQEEKNGGWDTNTNGGNWDKNKGGDWGSNNGGNYGNGGDGKKQKGGKNKKNQQQNGGGSNTGGGGGKRDQEGSGFGNPFDGPPAPQEPQRGRLKPDDAWSQNDCEILEWLESTYEESKWHHMQSGFYNWTGRMVNWELILQKFMDDGAV